MYRLTGADGQEFLSKEPGRLGGNLLRDKIYGRLDCPAALKALRDGGEAYRAKRVFFADEGTAIEAGFRPCGRCLRDRYRAWRARRARPD
jgi:methylphosphotriester-DNA--protein-cysteine methyltransferase